LVLSKINMHVNLKDTLYRTELLGWVVNNNKKVSDEIKIDNC